MSWQHPSLDELDRFLLGEVPETDAVRIAVHIDECVACASAATAADPLAAAFASVDDPLVPNGLAEDVHEALRRPPTVGPEPAVAGMLLVAAAAVFVALGSPTGMVADGLVAARAIGTALGAVASRLGDPTPYWTIGALMLLIAGTWTARRLEHGRVIG